MNTYTKKTQGAMHRALRYVSRAIDRDSSRWCCECIHVEGGEAVATNGALLICVKLPEAMEDGNYEIVRSTQSVITLMPSKTEKSFISRWREVIPNHNHYYSFSNSASERTWMEVLYYMAQQGIALDPDLVLAAIPPDGEFDVYYEHGCDAVLIEQEDARAAIARFNLTAKEPKTVSTGEIDASNATDEKKS